jgi:CPA1 family monovalent cation:H+ antiporter
LTRRRSARTEAGPEFVIEPLRAPGWTAQRIQEHGASEPPYTASTYRQLRRELLDVDNAELSRLYHDGTISDSTRQRIQRSLDLEHARLGEAP